MLDDGNKANRQNDYVELCVHMYRLTMTLFVKIVGAEKLKSGLFFKV